MATCKVYCKSCASMPEVPSRSVQVAVTSLPDAFANIGIETAKTDASWLLLYNRFYVLDQVLPFLAPLATELARVLKDDGVFILNAGCTPENSGMSGFASLLPLVYAEYVVLRSPLRLQYDIIVVQQADDAGEVYSSEWELDRGVATMQQHLLVFAKSENVKIRGADLIPTVWTYVMPSKVNEEAPTPFPTAIIAKLLTTFSDAGDTVLDPCAGLGTVWSVARAYNRNCVLYEINSRFVDWMKTGYPEAEFH